MGYRGYGLPVSKLISKHWIDAGCKKFDPDKVFDLLHMLCGGSKLQEYVLRS